MPIFNSKKIKTLVNDGKILAVMPDTEIFEQYGFNLSNRNLTALKQFKGTNIQVLLPSFLMDRMRHEIAKKARAVSGKPCCPYDYVRDTEGNVVLGNSTFKLALHDDYSKAAEPEVAAFFDAIGAIEIPAKSAIFIDPDLGTHFNLRISWWAGEIDYDDSGYVALESAEAWAKVQDGYVLAVGRDVRWSTYAKKSSRIIQVNDLATALDFFNDDGRAVANDFMDAFYEEGGDGVSVPLSEALDNYCSEVRIAATASSGELEIRHSEVDLDESEFAQSLPIQVLTCDDETVTFSLRLTGKTEIGAHIMFYEINPIDRSYNHLGHVVRLMEGTLDVQVVFVVRRRAENEDDPVPLDVEINGPILKADFGMLDPCNDSTDKMGYSARKNVKVPAKDPRPAALERLRRIRQEGATFFSTPEQIFKLPR
jgi:hypothetical protein